MTKQSKLNTCQANGLSHTIQKYYGENGEGGCDDVPNGSGESYIAIYKMSCNFMLEI